MRRILALVGLIAVASTAHAEPIATYAVTIQSQSGSGRLLVHSGTAHDQDASYAAYASVAIPQGSAGTITEPAGVLALISIPKPVYQFDAGEPPAGLDTQFELDFTVTDTASGQTSTAGMPVFGRMIPGEPFALMGSGEAYLTTTDLNATFVLGAYRYQFKFGDSYGEDNSYIQAEYSITPLETVATPEPATAALALLGLGGIAARRFCRSRSA